MKINFLLGCSLIVFCSRSFAAEAAANETNVVLISARLVEALAEEARTNHPALRAADARADAAVWNASAVRAWEDPTAKFGVMGAERDKRSDDGDLLYGVEQKLPLFGKPRATRDVAQAEATVQRQEANFRGLEIRRDLVKQLVRVALSEHLLELGREDLASLETIASTSEDKFRNGFATAVEVLQAHNERARRANLLRTEESLLRAERTSLNRLLNRPTDAVWPSLLLPAALTNLPPVSELVRHASETAPRLNVLRASLRQAESSVALARKQRLPEVGVGLEGRQYADTGEFREGVFTLGISIPWGNRSRYQADIKREQRKAEAAQLDIADLQLALREEITRLAIQIENAGREAVLYRTDIAPRTQQALESAHASWLNNRGTLRDVLEARRLLLESRAMVARAQAEQHSLLAELALHCGMGELENFYHPSSSTNTPTKGSNP
jgi:cobalt-zinc-cadmium efflux system outer membrane protein